MTKRMLQVVSLALAAFLRLFGTLASRVTPKSARIWIVGSWDGHRFADNAKWLFLWYHAKADRLDGNSLTWITRSRRVFHELRERNLPVCYLWSVRGLWLSLRAGVHLFDSDSRGTAPWSARHAFTINLFHGIALKHVGRDIATGSSPIRRAHHGLPLERAFFALLCPWFTERCSAVTASSVENARVMTSAFQPREPAWITGLPRNDVLGLADDELSSSFASFEGPLQRTSTRTVVYMPTFRDHARRDRRIPLPWPALHDLLEQQDARMILRLHTLDAAQVPSLRDFPRISVDDPRNDPYPRLRHADVLISDYSSVMFDFLLVDKPILLYCYDLDDYVTHARGLYYTLEEIAPGPIATESGDLLRSLHSALTSAADSFAARRQSVRDLLVSTSRGQSCAALDRHLKSRLFKQ